LVALAVDPYTVHVYWEVASEKLAQAQSQIRQDQGTAQAVLRFHDVNHEGSPLDRNGYFDIEVGLDSRNWYVPLWAAGESYHVALGLRSESGGFALLTQSNVVQTPRATPESRVDERFMRVSREHRAEIVPPPPSESFSGKVAVPPQAAETLRPAGVSFDSMAVLRKKLGELYAFRRWAHKPPRKEEAVEARNPDLADMSEKKFTTGFSSALPRRPDH